jgi:predicted nucleotidyltransferase
MDNLPIEIGRLARRNRAVSGTISAIQDLRDLGVNAKVIGSLAKGKFGPFSDVDLLIVSCPPELKYAIEGKVEDRLIDIPFHVVYLDEIPTPKVSSFADGAIDASHLR